MTVVFDLVHTLFTIEVARAARLSVCRIQQLDHVLEPVRDRQNRRRYSPEKVAKFLEARGINVEVIAA